MNIRSVVKAIVPRGPCLEFLRMGYGWSLLQKTRFFPNGCDITPTNEGWKLCFTDHPQLKEPTIYPPMNLGFVTAVIEELPSYFPLDIPRNALVVDAGAFPGDFTVAAARLVPDGKVLALEPEPHNREYLERMVHLNGMGKRVEVLPYALSDRCGSDELIKGTNSSHLVSLASKSGVTFKADTVDLDSLLNGENRPMIVKMDIEGAELLAIQGASRTLSRGAQFAIAAYHVVRGQPTHRALEGMFSSVGYKTRIGDHEHLVLFAEKD